MTIYSTERSLELQNGTISGQITIPGAQNSKITSLLLPIIEDGTERLILVNKNRSGITVGDIADEFGNCEVDFDSVEIEETMVLPSFTDTDFMAQVRLTTFFTFIFQWQIILKPFQSPESGRLLQSTHFSCTAGPSQTVVQCYAWCSSVEGLWQ